MNNQKELIIDTERSRKEIAVITFGFLKTLLVISFMLLLMKLGYEGFKAGEMGIMVGIFVVVMMLFLIPVCVLKIIVSIKLLKRKRWALIASIIFTGIFILLNFLLLSLGFCIFLALFIILLLILFLEISLLKSSVFS